MITVSMNMVSSEKNFGKAALSNAAGHGAGLGKAAMRRQVSRLALRSPVTAAVACGATMIFAPTAYAQCAIDPVAGSVTCATDTTTQNSTYPTGGGRARHLSGTYGTPMIVTVADGVDVNGLGLGVTNLGTGGVVVRLDGDVRIDANTGPTVGPGAVSGSVNNGAKRAAALGISAAGGDILVTGSGNISASPVQISGLQSDGLAIINGGSGTVTVDLNGDIYGRRGGILVQDTAIGGDISITLGESATVWGGVYASSSSQTANVSILSNMATTRQGIGAYASGSGDIDLRLNTNMDIIGGGSVSATHVGTGSINIQTTEHIRSDAGGIRAESRGGGDIIIRARSVETYIGVGPGVYAIQNDVNGYGDIDVEVSGTVKGRVGIELLNKGLGDIRAVLHDNVTSPSLQTPGAYIYGKGNVDVLMHKDASGSGAGVMLGIMLDGTGDINFTGHGNYHGAANVGLSVFNFGTGDTNITVAGRVSSDTGHAVQMRDYFITPPDPWSPQPGPVVGALSGRMTATLGSISALATDADGIEMSSYSANGEILLTVNGDVEASRTGVVAELVSPEATGDIILITKGNVTASTGIDAENSGTGNVQVTQATDTLITASNGHGIWGASQSGNTLVNVGGKIFASAPAFAGVAGRTTSGNLTVNVAASADIDPDYGIDLTTVDGALLVNQAGTVDGDIAAISLNATGTGTATINNSGLITSPQNAVQGVLNGGAFTFANNNRFDGAVNVSGSNIAGSTLTNNSAGIANFGSLASSFSGNFVNAGVANIGTGGVVRFLGNGNNSNRINLAGNSQVRVDGNFTNSGTLNAGNGVTTDRVTVGGNYLGGGQILADFNGSAMTADQMTIGGAASGTTNVQMNRIGPVALLAGGFLPVVTVGGAAPADAFVGTILSNGFVQESFAQNPNNAQQFGVMQAVNPNGGVLAGISLIAEAASSALDEPMRPYITSRTDAADKSGHLGLWMRLGGGRTDQRVHTTVAGGPLLLSSSEDVRTKFYSAQIGLDYAMLNMGGGWNMHIGAMGGWYSGDTHFASGAQIKVEAPFAGVYALIDNGGLAIEGSVRHEWRRYSALMPSLLGAGPRDFDGSATAASIYASYRIGGATGFAATSFVGFQYASAKIDALPIDADTRFEARNDKSKIGRAGIRVGYRFGDEANVTVEPFGGVSYMRNWSRGTESVFQLDDLDTDFTARAQTWRETVRYTAGIDIRAHHSRVTGYVAANLDDSGRRDGKSLHAGLRYNF